MSRRLCVLSPHCGIAAETTSGAEVYERELLKRISVKHSVVVLLTKKAYRRSADVSTARYAIDTPLPMTWWLAPLILTEEMRNSARPDVLRVHSLKYIGPSALYARRVFWWGVPIVAHHHHLDAGWHPIERYVSNHVDRVVVGSEFAKRQMAERGWRTDHVRVVPYAVDERFQPVDRSGRKTVRVLYLGGLKKRKNVALLLRIWPEIERACPTAWLIIAGDGPERARLVRMARGHRVMFVGYVPEVDKPRVYQNADVFVFPSRMEGFGLPVLEAMASGLPAVTSRNGSLPELAMPALVMDDEAEWIATLMELCAKPEVRRFYGSEGHKMARAYSWDRCVRETLAVYEEVAR